MTREGRVRFLEHPRRAVIAACASAIIALSLGLAACADDDGGDGASSTRIAPPPATSSDMTTTPAPTTAPEPATEVVTIYLADDQGDLVAVSVATDGDAPLQRAMEALADPPASAGEPAALPPGTVVRSARAEGGVATIDLSGEFADGYPSGGSAAEAAILGPVVYTATEFDGIDAALIVVNGEVPDLIGSSYDLSEPLVREDIPVSIAASP